ncbi:MAG: FHA domain-containing serine/threonine-protein kinase [Gemmataceae bacterium]
MSLQLAVLTGPDKDRIFTLNTGPDLMLGRSVQAQYQLSDAHVGRNHCQVVLDKDHVTVICNGGDGGTFVNGHKIDRRQLELGDVLKIGDTELRLQLDEPPPDAAGAPAGESLDDLVGQTLAHFTIDTLIGTGRTGVVFHATDTKDNRPVALKVLQPEFASDDHDDQQQFIRGIKLVLPLHHPNLVTLYAAGKTHGHCWMALEYVAGKNLQQIIDRIGVVGLFDWRKAFKVTLQVGRALVYAAEHRIVHRNVTPTNILRDTASKNVKLGDLVLAKALAGPLARQIPPPGEVVGDVAYLSPERTRGLTDLDARSDLYSLGATVYALLTGHPPCGGSTPAEKIHHIRRTPPEKPTKYQKGMPTQFEAVVLKLLAKQPEHRFPSAADLVEELEQIARFLGVHVD